MSIKRLSFIMILSLFMLFPSVAQAEPTEQKIAVIDIQKVVAASPQVKALKASQEEKNKNIANFIQKAQADVNKQKDEKSKQAVAKKYEKQLISKKEANIKEYREKLKATDKSINEQVSKIATDMGYTMVLPKMSVIYGGDDITDAVIKVIK